jgi:diapolycopene oxygenase
MRVVIVGAGISGLACASRLAAAGHDVFLLERSSHVGGKAAEATFDGYRFDLGPSLFTLPENLDAVFIDAGKDPRAYYDYSRLSTCCVYHFSDGTQLRAHAEPARFAAEIEAVTGEPHESVLAYLDQARRLYDATAPVFLENSLHRYSTYTSRAALNALTRVPPRALLTSMHAVNRRWFSDPRVVQLFDRYATYNGSDPYRASGVLTQIPHLEHNLGAYFPRGGMAVIPKALSKLAQDLGVRLQLNTPVRRILHQNGRVTGVQTNSGAVPADIVVSAGDIVATYKHLLSDVSAPRAVTSQERSSSAVIFYWGVQRTFLELDVHNIFFSADYEREFRQIFVEKTVPDDPTIYVHVSSKVEPNDAPEGCENWFVMVNVPADEGQAWPSLIDQLRRRVVQRLSERLGTQLADLIVTESTLHPQLIEQRTSSHGGALYGASSNQRSSAFHRHANISSTIRNLYFCGGSVHPGGGIPLCLNSANIVAREVARRGE